MYTQNGWFNVENKLDLIELITRRRGADERHKYFIPSFGN